MFPGRELPLVGDHCPRPPIYPICHRPSLGSYSSHYDASDGFQIGALSPPLHSPLYILPCHSSSFKVLYDSHCPEDKCQATWPLTTSPPLSLSPLLLPALPRSFGLAPLVELALHQPPRWTLRTRKQSCGASLHGVSRPGEAGKHVDPVSPTAREL